jgi:ferredoxin
MVIQVNLELCTGCGVCVDVCSVGAIQLLDQRAVIDDALCIMCEVCMSACPNEAITKRFILEPSLSFVTLDVAESHPVSVQNQKPLQETAVPVRCPAPLASAALAFIGREVAPRLVDVLFTALERRLARPTKAPNTPLSTYPRSLTRKNRGLQRQVRFRGGHTGKSNP